MQDARETIRGAKLYFCSQTEIQERYEVTMSQIYLEMNHIKKTFGELEVLKDISLSVHKGEVVSVIGPSGSGKSTLLRCATMLEKMDGGELSFLGEKAAWEENGKCVYANKKQLKEIRKNFGLVFQNFNLFPHYTVMKNIIDAPVCVDDVSKEEAKERAWKLLKQLGLSDKADAYPYQLSGGQQQRVSIARVTPAVLSICSNMCPVTDSAALSIRTTDGIPTPDMEYSSTFFISSAFNIYFISTCTKPFSHVILFPAFPR